MAIDYHDLTSITDTLKIVYGEGLQNQFNDEQMTYHLFPKSDRKPAGLGYEFGIRNARSQSVGARGESQVLPDPLVGKTDKGRINAKYMYGVLRLTGPAIETGKGNVAAFVDTLSDAVTDVYESLVNDMNRQTWSDGYGLLGTLSTTSGTLSTSATWTGTYDNDRGIQYMEEGMVVDHYESTAIDQSSVASRISSIDPATNIVTFEANDGTYKANHPIVAARSYTIAANTIADGAFMVRIGARRAAHATTDSSYELTGLEAIYDDGTAVATFENITVANFPKWRANIISNGGVDRELSIDLMLQALQLSQTRAGKRIATIRMGLGQRRKYANLLLPEVRFAPQELKGGYETLTFAGGNGAVEIVVDPKAQPNKLFFEPADTIKKYELKSLGWDNNDPGMHQRSGYDEFDQFLNLYTNLGCEQRNGLVLIKDLKEPKLYS